MIRDLARNIRNFYEKTLSRYWLGLFHNFQDANTDSKCKKILLKLLHNTEELGPAISANNQNSDNLKTVSC